jgi:flagellar biosynthesis GTPase FlhF
MDTSTIDTPVRTFRGRNLDEILPQVRSELGADAIVVRRREGLAGGVAGFFQRPFAEVDARAALPHERDGEPRNDRATAEGLAAPAVQALVEQASPFADALARATAHDGDGVAERAHEVLVAAADAGLYGPQPNRAALEPFVADEPAPADEVTSFDGRMGSDPFMQSDGRMGSDPFMQSDGRMGSDPSPVVAELPASAASLERRLVASGLSPALAADVVAEAAVHGLPFSGPRLMKKLVRTALARRLPVMACLGGSARTVAFVGAGGAGKSAAVARLASAYAAAGADVAVVALGAADGGRSLAGELEPLGVSVIAAADARQARTRLGRHRPALLLIDTPAAGPGDLHVVAALADELRALKAAEVHLAVPATISATAGAELVASLAPLGITHVALTHTDQTARPGAAIELAVDAARPLSYACSRERAEPADPADLARRLLP